MKEGSHRAWRARKGVSSQWSHLERSVFGDRIGFVLFLSMLVFAVCYWRIGFTINDNYTIANTLLALEHGRLSFEAATYGSLYSPGTHLVDGRVYGRNYGHVVFAYPFLLAIRGISAVIDLPVVIVAGWSLLLLALLLQLGRLFDRPRFGAIGGSLLALSAFAAGLLTAVPIEPRLEVVMALQLSTIVATAAGVVLIYRLGTRLSSQRDGVVLGLAYGVVLPTAFWASIPKRHALTTALLVASLYFLYRAREARSEEGLRFRALAYVPIGLTAWVHAPEGFLLLVGVGLADVVTARSNGPRELALVTAVLFVSLVPFFLTNALISGNPVQPPRFLPGYTEAVNASSTTATTEVARRSSGASSLLSSAVGKSFEFLNRFRRGIGVIVGEPDRLVDTFLSSQGFESGDQNMSVLESAPLLGVLVPGVVSLTRIRPHQITGRLRADRPRAAIGFAGGIYAILLVVIYMPSLPLHAQITVRYLLPLYPLALLGIIRLRVVRTVLDREWVLLAWTYAGGVLIGTQLFLLTIVLLDAALREAMQFGTLLGLGVATMVAAWSVGYALGVDGEHETKLGAVLLGLAAAAGTAFLLVSAWYYFPYGQFALPFVPGS